MQLHHEAVHTEDAPKAIGPYSQAVRAGDFVFLSGQIALDPKSGAMVGEGDVGAEMEQVMKNLQAVLLAAGTSFASVVKSHIYLVDMGHFPIINEIYSRYFTAAPPARATVAVAALPRGAKVEIDMIATVSRG